MPIALRSGNAPLTVDDYQRRARRRLPDMVWSYVTHGADDLVSQRANRSAYDRYRFAPRVLTGKATLDLSCTVAGQQLDLPVLLAPVGLVGLAHWQGERGAALAAEHLGTRSIVSTSASWSLEEIAAATSKHHLFQLYPWTDLNRGGRDLIGELMQRAQAAGFAAMVVTVDVPTIGNRVHERRRGMGSPPTITPRRILDGALHPRWTYGFLRHKRYSQRNLVDAGGARAAMRSVDRAYTMMRPDLTWSDFAWMCEQWDGPVLIKGVLTGEDAARAVDAGADGIIVSNHGGRQLDHARATLDALVDVVDVVAGRAQVLLDGGIRRGTDIAKAICLGADAVCIGRPYVYGIAADGVAGVEGVLGILRDELRRAMALMGVGSLRELGRDLLVADQPPPELDRHDERKRTWS